ncbi:WDGH domain-containing protein [Spirosoma sordidisoli]|uniref:WDGH domain-containing protein n=1 Tax=Spirosoma sordidisoli TaxID=2502893 RepID=A0A4Q2UPS2_9BACT|nr:hypothetical protein [Spirosoma sordidisoli]RYC69610.1 hypothetical protein EQG79_13485 [Spirosoma sordidisoli]
MQPTVEQINEQIKLVDSNQVSDGYHTFGELYEHRICLWIALCEIAQTVKDRDEYCYEHIVWRSKAHSDSSEWDGWFLLGLMTEPGKQMTYHLPMSKWDECSFARTLEKAPEYDGHTSSDVLARIKELSSLL